MFKRGLAFAAAVVLAVSAVAGCSNSLSGGSNTGESADVSNYPSQEIEWLVPYTAGGSSDQMARLIAKYSKQYLGVDIIIENVGGGSGNVG